MKKVLKTILKVLKTILKTISYYVFFNAVIAVLHELIKFIEIAPVRVVSDILSIFETVFSWVLYGFGWALIPILPIILGLVIYYFIRILFFKDKHKSFKYLFINCFSFLVMTYFIAQNIPA